MTVSIAAAAEKPWSDSLESQCFGDPKREGFRISVWDERGESPIRLSLESGLLVLMLNIAGAGVVRAGGVSSLVEAGNFVLSCGPRARQQIERLPAERHRFVVVEMARSWVGKWTTSDSVREPVRRLLASGRGGGPSCEVHGMGVQLSQLAAELMQPPRASGAAHCWRHAKVLELAAHGLFESAESELFCDRTKRAGRERIARAQEILQSDLENPPSLGELGKMVGCSPFYLSRMFRQETGVTISAYLRRLRLDRAAELIRAGEANVTEAAMTVGYSSLSHFSKAFAETFGCCPCLYGRKG